MRVVASFRDLESFGSNEDLAGVVDRLFNESSVLVTLRRHNWVVKRPVLISTKSGPEAPLLVGVR